MERADISFHATGTANSEIAWLSAVQLLYPLLCTYASWERETVWKMAQIFGMHELFFISQNGLVTKKQHKQMSMTESIEFPK